MIASSGTIVVPGEPAPVAGPQGTVELRPGTIDVESPVSDARGVGHRTPAGWPCRNEWDGGGPDAGAELRRLNFFQQRFSTNGNQFSVEPPDQGLCVGNNKVVEIVNSVYPVYDFHGRPLINPVDVNHLFGYSDAINRQTHVIGPDVFDPSCLYDAATKTFFVIASTLDVSSDGSAR